MFLRIDDYGFAFVFVLHLHTNTRSYTTTEISNLTSRPIQKWKRIEFSYVCTVYVSLDVGRIQTFIHMNNTVAVALRRVARTHRHTVQFNYYFIVYAVCCIISFGVHIAFVYGYCCFILCGAVSIQILEYTKSHIRCTSTCITPLWRYITGLQTNNEKTSNECVIFLFILLLFFLECIVQ